MAKHKFDYDLFVIGAGSGGVRASRMSSSYGAKVGIAEEYRFGGTCVIRGCVPKKLMVYASHFGEDFEDAAGYGWSVPGEPTFDWSTFIANKDREIGRLEGLYRQTLTNAGVTMYEGRAHIADENTVEVNGETITAETILVATGGKPNLPDIPGIELAITSNEAFHLEELPKRVLVLGGGYIAVEFAGIFHGLGSEVTLNYRGDLILRGFDMDLRERLSKAMKARGINMVMRAIVAKIEKVAGGLDVTLSNGDVIQVDQVMFAIGRAPNVKGLGLERVGVELTQTGAIAVDDYSQTSNPSVYAVGDVTDRIALTPVAIKEGHAFALTKYKGIDTKPDHKFVPSAVFSQPPLASVGYTEEEANEAFDDVHVYTSDFRAMRHTLAGREERSFCKVLVDGATDRVIGAHMIGNDGPEIMQGLGVAIKAGITKAQLDSTVAIHPSSAEEFVLMPNRTR